MGEAVNEATNVDVNAETDDDTLRYEQKLRLRYLRGLAFAALFCGASSWFVEPLATSFELALVALAATGLAGRALTPVFWDPTLRRSSPLGSMFTVTLGVLGVALSVGALASRLPVFD